MASRRTFLKTAGLLGLATVTGGMAEAVNLEQGAHFDRLNVTAHTATIGNAPPGFPPLNVLFVTDLHVGCPSVSLRALKTIVDQANDQRPDIILLGGDHLIASNCDSRTDYIKPQPIADVLGGLHAPYGVFSVLGNHDWDRPDGDWKMRAALEDRHITVLDNERVTLWHGQTSFDLIGLPDYTTRDAFSFNASVFERAATQPTIIVSHDPIYFAQAPEHTVMFSGHTHGGQFTLPGCDLYLPTDALPQRWAYGKITETVADAFADSTLIVSSGIGTSTVPFKNRPNEMVKAVLGPPIVA